MSARAAVGNERENARECAPGNPAAYETRLPPHEPLIGQHLRNLRLPGRLLRSLGLVFCCLKLMHPSLDGPRRGLAIAGGGAKGAYAFGCLCAFERAGVRFIAASGTSAGALNAAVLATRSFALGWRLWKGLSFAGTYPIQLPERLRSTRWRALVAGTLLVLAHSFVGSLRAHRTPLTLPLRVAGVAVGLMLLAYGVYLAWIRVGPWYSGAMAVVAGPGVLWFFKSVLAPRGREERDAVWKSVAQAAFAVTLAALLSLIDRSLNAMSNAILATAALALASGVTLLFCLSMLNLGERILGWLSAHTVFGRDPLEVAVSEVVSHREFSFPTYVCVAELREVYDPWRAQWISDAYGEAQLDDRCEYYPSLDTRWVPVYLKMNDRSIDHAVSLLLASAALPFGLVPSVRFGNDTYVDGGVADNVPWYPLVRDHELDELWIVDLEPASREEYTSRLANQFPIRARELAAAAYSVPQVMTRREWRMTGGPSTLYPPPSLPAYCPPGDLKVFAPKRVLGTFLSGTLNFDGAYAQRLARLGFRETLAELRRLDLWDGSEDECLDQFVGA